MVKEKKTVHRIQMTEGKLQIISSFFRNITLKPPLIYRQPSEIFCKRVSN